MSAIWLHFMQSLPIRCGLLLAWSPSELELGVRVDSLLTLGAVSASATVRCRCRVGGPPSRSADTAEAAVCAWLLRERV
jgi:hypothetical protein